MIVQPPGDSYGFIDGNYLDSVFKSEYAEVVGLETAVSLETVKAELGLRRVFYYAAVDEEARPGENSDATATRVAAANDRLDHINAIDGFHVRQGSVRGKTSRQPRRQKQVDVQLAVDALLHAINRNMREAVLVAGDLDFKPLVDALVSLGIHTTIWCATRSSSKELRSSADKCELITPQVAARWAPYSADPAYAVPREIDARVVDHRASEVQTAEWKDGARLSLRRGEHHHFIVAHDATARFVMAYRHGSPETLKRYFLLLHGKVTWVDVPPPR